MILRAALLLLLLFVPSAALAQRDAAERLVEDAVAAYKQGDFAKAGAFFLEAYELSEVPAQLRNAAKAYQDAEDLDQAEALWQRFAELEITPSERGEAEAQLALIEERRRTIAAEEEARRAREAARLAASSTVAVAPPVSAEAPALKLPVGPIVTLAGALAFAVAGGAVYLHAEQRLGRLDDQLDIVDDDALIIGIHRDDAQAELDGVNDERLIAVVLGGIAGAAAIAGAVWWLLDLDLGSTGPVASVTGEGALIGLAGAW